MGDNSGDLNVGRILCSFLDGVGLLNTNSLFFVGLGLVPSLSCYALSKNRFNKCKVDGGMHPDHSLSLWDLFLENQLKPSLSHCQFLIIALGSVGIVSYLALWCVEHQK